jgi:hypothetical protein
MNNLTNILNEYRDTLLKNIKENITNLILLIDQVNSKNIIISDYINIPTKDKDVILNNLVSIEEMLKKSIFGRGYNAGKYE